MHTFFQSLGSFSWIASLFGLRQLAHLMMFPVRRRHRSEDDAAELDGLTRSIEAHLGPTLKSIFRSGDRILRSVVDLTFRRRPARGRTAGPGGPHSWAHRPTGEPVPGEPVPGRPVSTAPRSEPASPPVSGWGPMPPIPESPGARAD